MGFSCPDCPHQRRLLRPVMVAVERSLLDRVQVRMSGNLITFEAQHIRSRRINKGHPPLVVQTEYSFGYGIENQGVIIAQLLNLLRVSDMICDIAGDSIYPYYLVIHNNWNINRIDLHRMPVFVNQRQIIALRLPWLARVK